MFKQKISRILENYKLSTKRNASNFIKNNEILVNNKKVCSTEFLANSDKDEIKINGTILEKTNNLYIIFNKPLGTVCSTVSDSHKTIYEFIKNDYKKSKNCGTLHSAGRLDSETSGLLILTTNGALSHFLTSPENHIKKTYQIEIQEKVPIQQQIKFSGICAKGIYLPPEKKAEEYFTKPAELIWISENKCSLTISEGQFHQVRRMIKELNLTLISLKRTKIANIILSEDLKPGEYKIVDENYFNDFFIQPE